MNLYNELPERLDGRLNIMCAGPFTSRNERGFVEFWLCQRESVPYSHG